MGLATGEIGAGVLADVASGLVAQPGLLPQFIYPPPHVGNGYGHQVAEVARCLREGLTESPYVPLDDTVGVLEALDDARRQLGVRYPADDEEG